MARRFVHDEVRQMIGAFADGELPRRTQRMIAAHLSRCARCRSELLLQRSLAQALRREPAKVASPQLRRRIQRFTESLTPPATKRRRRE